MLKAGGETKSVAAEMENMKILLPQAYLHKPICLQGIFLPDQIKMMIWLLEIPEGFQDNLDGMKWQGLQ